MILYHYVDSLPSIPEQLIDDMLTRLPGQKLLFNVPPRPTFHHDQPVANIDYNRYQLTHALEQWICEHVCDWFSCIGLQTQTASPDQHTHLPHTDTYPRRWVLNYNIQPGGDNVITKWYQESGQPAIRDHCTRPGHLDDLILLDQVTIEPHRWHVLNTSVLHGVDNIQSQRVSISMSFPEEPVKLYHASH